MNPTLTSLPSAVGSFLDGRFRAFDGPLTESLVREPGRFGVGQVPRRLVPDATAHSVCGFCSVGCSLKIHLRDGEAVNLTPNPDYPVNLGMACPKGWESLAPLAAPDRATRPLLRNRGSGDLREIDWPTAAHTFSWRFREILEEHGPESVAFLSTGQICTEEMALLGAFAKFGMGLIHGDGNTRQCMATAVSAYKESFGFDAPPFAYADLEESDTIILIGSNLCIAHPILWQRILRNGHAPEIVVIDPRKTETAMQATRHVALEPKSDLILFYGIAHLIIARGWVDEGFVGRHTREFESFAEHVAAFTPERVAARTGLAIEELETLAGMIGTRERVSFWWTMGVNQGHEAVRTAQAIINLALMTGNIGRPGTGANSITGQCNAMGSRLFSNTTSLLGGHDFTDAAHRAKVSRILGIDVGLVPDRPSLAYDQIIEGIAAGRIKGLWVVATNTAHSWGDQARLSGILDQLDFLVVQDMYGSTETARRADLLLPAAGWGEKEGTFINSERRIGLTKKVSRAPGQALADFSIFRLLAEYWGCGELFQHWTSPEAVFGILGRLSEGRPCDFSGIADYGMLEDCGGVQWPFPAGGEGGPPAPERRLFGDGRFFTEDGRALFKFEAPREREDGVDDEYPYLMLTGRGSSAQWHTQTRTGKSEVLRKLHPVENEMEMHPDDARDCGVRDGGRVRVTSRSGSVVIKVRLTPTVRPGQLFVPMHFPEANQLTRPLLDPQSRQPDYKACAVNVASV